MAWWRKKKGEQRSRSTPESRAVPVRVLDYAALNEKLLEFEDIHAITTGERVSSAEFHDRYRRGDAGDVPNALEWATFYELVREYGRRAAESELARPLELSSARPGDLGEQDRFQLTGRAARRRRPAPSLTCFGRDPYRSEASPVVRRVHQARVRRLLDDRRGA
jgi:hypothetical protein